MGRDDLVEQLPSLAPAPLVVGPVSSIRVGGTAAVGFAAGLGRLGEGAGADQVDAGELLHDGGDAAPVRSVEVFSVVGHQVLDRWVSGEYLIARFPGGQDEADGLQAAH